MTFGDQELDDWSDVLDVSESTVNGTALEEGDGIRRLLCIKEC